MKKNMVVVVVLIGLGIAGLPVLNGMIMEKRVRLFFQEINQREARPADICELIRYERHFFSSEIEWKIVSGTLEKISGLHEIVFIDRVEHGLTGVVTVTSLEKNQWFMDLVNGNLKGKNPLNIKTEFNYSGKMKSRLFLNSVSFTEGSDIVTIKPGEATLSIDWRKDRIGLNMNFAGLEIAGKRLAISNMTFDYEFLSHPEEAAVSIEMNGRLDLFQDGDREIKNTLMGIHIKHMDAGGYEDLKAFFLQGAAGISSNSALDLEDADAICQAIEKQVAEKGFEWFGICEKLLKKNLEIEVSKFKTQLPEGNIEAAGRIKVEKDIPLAGLISLIMSPSKILDYISLKSHIILPKIIDPKDQRLLFPLFPGMATGLFIMEKDHLIHRAQTRDGILFLNEKEVMVNR